MTANSELFFSAERNAWIVSGLSETRAILRSRQFSTEAYGQFGPDIGHRNEMLMSTGTRHRLLKHLFTTYISSAIQTLQRRLLEPTAQELLPRVVSHDKQLLFRTYIYPYFRRCVYGIIGLLPDQGDEIVACMRVAHTTAAQRGKNSPHARAAVQVLGERVREVYEKASANRWGAISRILNDPCNPTLMDSVHLTLPLLHTLALDLDQDLTWGLVRKLLDLPPEERRDLLCSRTRLFRACHEIVRLDAFNILPRTALQDVPVGGHLIRKGNMVFIMLGALGKNPQVFARPEEFHEERANLYDYPGFGMGDHYCIGELLAKTIASTAAAVLFRNVRDLRPRS